MQPLEPYQRRLIFVLLFVVLVGVILKTVDRQRQALSFDIEAFLDGYKYSAPLDTSKPEVLATSDALRLQDLDPENSDSRDSKPIINVNKADMGQLQMLPGIGPVLAAEIIAYRDSAGPLQAPDDLLKVKGIGRIKLANMIEYIEF